MDAIDKFIVGGIFDGSKCANTSIEYKTYEGRESKNRKEREQKNPILIKHKYEMSICSHTIRPTNPESFHNIPEWEFIYKSYFNKSKTNG